MRVLLGEIWTYRGLLPLLARQEFHARYRSAKLGLLWSAFIPLFQGVVIGFVFSRIVRVDTGYQFGVYVFSGVVVWAYFNVCVAAAASSIVDSAAITTRIYYPRLIPPLIPVAANIPAFTISLSVVVLAMVPIGLPLRPTLLALPLAMIVTIIWTSSFAALVALMHVYFRDVRYLVQALLMAWFYATPVFYRVEMAGSLRPIVVANPLVGGISLLRYAIFGEADDLALTLCWSGAATVVAVALVAWAYARYNRVAADRL